MGSNVYILAPNCVVCDGYKRSTILDLQRQTFKIISIEQSRILSNPINPLKLSEYDQYFQILVSELLLTNILIEIPEDQVANFKRINNNFFSSSRLNNFILCLSKLTLKSHDKIVTSLDKLGCKHIEIRLNNEVSIEELTEELKKYSDTTISTIDIFIPYKSKKQVLNLFKLRQQIFELHWVNIYNCPLDIAEQYRISPIPNTIFITDNLSSNKNCGNISPFYFAINIPTYTESQKFNSCLNCKLSVDFNGIIKNCPSMLNSYGNISDKLLEETINDFELNSIWQINKDKIKTCKDCEFRYICTDCRAYLEDPANIFSKPLKCGYNPYTLEWSEWDTDPSKQKSIDYYDLNKIV